MKKVITKTKGTKKPSGTIKLDDRPLDYTKYIREYERKRKAGK